MSNKKIKLLQGLIITSIFMVVSFLILKELDIYHIIRQDVQLNNWTLNILLFTFAGLIDGINPCALSMLLFFIMTMFNISREKMNILLIGMFFAFGTFVAYFSAGLGMARLIRYIELVNYLPPIIYGFTIIISFILGVLNFKDAYYARKQDLKNITLQLPQKNKKFIHNMISKVSKGRYKYIIAFLIGFFVTLGELLCTGQIYFATMIALQGFSGFSHMFFLLLFNVGFIIPILVITFVVHKTRELLGFSDVLLNRLWVIKIVTGVLMFILGFFILKELIILI